MGFLKSFLGVSFRIKLVGLFIFFTFLCGIAILYFVFSIYLNEAMHEEMLLSQFIAKELAVDSKGFMLKKHPRQLDALLAGELADNDRILYAFAENKKGKIFASAFKKGFYLNILNSGRSLNIYGSKSNNHDLLSTVKVTSPVYGEIYDTSAPIRGGKLGIMRVGLSLKYAGYRFFQKSIIFISVLIMLFIMLLSISITLMLTNPLKKINEAVQRIKKGDYDIHLNASSISENDEIGKLSKAFNEMALGLKEAEDERDKNEDLRKNFVNRIINAQEDERKNISHGLHDRLGQFLFAVKLKLRMLEDLHDLNEIKPRILQIRKDLDNGVELIHKIVKDLRPPLLDDRGIVDAIIAYINDMAKNNENVKINFYPINLENNRFNKEIEINIYRIIQEAVLNSLRHAYPNNITIIIEKYKDNIRGVIVDDGIGFECNKNNDGQFGITGMMERAKLLGGELTIESEKGIGTVVKFRIPTD